MLRNARTAVPDSPAMSTTCAVPSPWVRGSRSSFTISSRISSEKRGEPETAMSSAPKLFPCLSETFWRARFRDRTCVASGAPDQANATRLRVTPILRVESSWTMSVCAIARRRLARLLESRPGIG